MNEKKRKTTSKCEKLKIKIHFLTLLECLDLRRWRLIVFLIINWYI